MQINTPCYLVLFFSAMGLVLPSRALAQQTAPSFTVSGSGDGAGYTSSAQVNVNWASPASCTPPPGAPSGSCHAEFCFTQDGTLGSGGMLVACQPGTQGAWGHSLSYNLGSDPGGTDATVWGEYRFVVMDSSGNYWLYPSDPSSTSVHIYAAIAPSASMNSPVGTYDQYFPSGSQAQLQFLNCAAEQWTSWATWNPEVTQFSPMVCNSSGSCADLSSMEPFTGYTYPWPADSSSGACPYAGGGYMYFFGGTYTPPVTFQQFEPGYYSTGQPLTCIPPGQTSTAQYPATCAILANGIGQQGSNSNQGDIPNDPPSSQSSGPIFSGYADPSMRADTLVSAYNPAGNNLYMSYSWAQIYAPSGTTYYTPSLEIHLAASCGIGGCSGSGGYPSGWNWNFSANLFPTYEFSGQVETLSTSGIYGLEPPATGPVPEDYYSSHEVSNLAEYVDGSTAYWYAVHLMYFVPVTGTVSESLVNGCLVISMAQDSPANLAWPTGAGSPPATCQPTDGGWANTSTSSTLVSYPMGFGNTNLPSPGDSFNPNLNLLAVAGGASGPNCTTWGEPAITVAHFPPGTSSGPMALYLAAECFTTYPSSNTYLSSSGYYVFYDLISSNGTVPATGWMPYPASSNGTGIMNFALCGTNGVPNLCSNNGGTSNTYQNGTFLTQFDWAVRADGTMVAVATPEYVASPDPEPSQPVQYGCLAMNFDLNAPYDGQSIFSPVIATIFDQDTGTSIGTMTYNEPSPNACTYDAQSNTGVTIVRHLQGPDGPNNNPVYYQIYSIVNSGVMP